MRATHFLQLMITEFIIKKQVPFGNSVIISLNTFHLTRRTHSFSVSELIDLPATH